jgi:hypothetical protein
MKKKDAVDQASTAKNTWSTAGRRSPAWLALFKKWWYFVEEPISKFFNSRVRTTRKTPT